MTNQTKDWFISAGEYSGELLASSLVSEVKKIAPEISFFGMGGDEMRSSGVSVSVCSSRMSVMGIAEVLAKLPDIVKIEQELLDEIERRKPEVCILVDYPGFHFRLAKRLKKRGFKVVQYVAPKVWAWGEKRLDLLKKDFDKVLGVLPFEQDFFSEHGVDYEYVGSPHYDRVSEIKPYHSDLFDFCDQTKIIAVLPGSRKSEIRRIGPEIKLIKSIMMRDNPSLLVKFIVPVAPNLSHKLVIEELCGDCINIPDSFDELIEKDNYIFVSGNSLEIMKLADAAVLTSGTATLECGLIGTPMVVLYKMNSLTYLYAKLKVKVKSISLVNLSVKKPFVPEHIQKIDHQLVAAQLNSLLIDPSAQKRQRDGLAEMNSRYFGNAEKHAANALVNITSQELLRGASE